MNYWNHCLSVVNLGIFIYMPNINDVARWSKRFWWIFNLTFCNIFVNQAGVTGAAMSGVVASEGGRRTQSSLPVLHSGSHFRHGLLQLMIHTIDPLNDGENFNYLKIKWQIPNSKIGWQNLNSRNLTARILGHKTLVVAGAGVGVVKSFCGCHM